MHTRDEFMLLWGCGLVCMDLSCSFTNRSPQGLHGKFPRLCSRSADFCTYTPLAHCSWPLLASCPHEHAGTEGNAGKSPSRGQPGGGVRTAGEGGRERREGERRLTTPAAAVYTGEMERSAAFTSHTCTASNQWSGFTLSVQR